MVVFAWPASAAIFVIPLVMSSPVLGFSQSAPLQKTLFVNCREQEPPKSVHSPVSISEGGTWRAYVEVRSDSECSLTTRLWVSRVNAPYRLLYLMPPKRTAGGNGMEILGWAKASRMLLVRAEEWQWGSDIGDTQKVLAIDAGTGVVYQPQLDAILEAHKDKHCLMRIADAGFSSERDVIVLIRARFSTALEVDETEIDAPSALRCAIPEEVWSFNFASGETKQVANTLRLQHFGKSLPIRP